MRARRRSAAARPASGDARCAGMAGNSMSLRARIILLFAAALILALAVAGYLGERLETKALESSLRERTVASSPHWGKSNCVVEQPLEPYPYCSSA